ncbi:MAG: hypothetical protein AB8B94_16575 [Hyphomicrobiales bacterium]
MSDENTTDEKSRDGVDESRRAALRKMGLYGVAPAVALILAPSKGRAFICQSPSDGCEPDDDDDTFDPGTL